VEFRVHENKAGLKIAGEFPIWGVGLNNYREHLLRYNPEWEWALQFEDYSVKQLHLRPLASPHNGFLLILAENGLVGLVTFTIFFLGITVAAVRSLRHTTGSARAVCFGLTVGLIGLVLQQVVDFSIWADPLLYTLALCAALLSVAPEVTREPA
jgi:O-antigen ligase